MEDLSIDDPNYDGPSIEAESCERCGSDDMNWDGDQRAYICGDCGFPQPA